MSRPKMGPSTAHVPPVGGWQRWEHGTKVRLRPPKMACAVSPLIFKFPSHANDGITVLLNGTLLCDEARALHGASQ